MGFASSRTVLLLHDGELADVRVIAESVGAAVVEGRAGQASPDWDVLVATPRHAKGDALRGGREKCVRIAVLDRNARALRGLVRREGIDLIVRRPVHPTALRLLLLHALYRGPERRSRRVAIGSAVRFRAGLLRKDGVLADLSLRGCQIVSRHAPKPKQALVVWVPDAANASKSFAVRGTVVRCFRTESGERAFGVDFGVVGKPVAAQLKLAIQAYLEGPATVATDAGVTQPIPAQRAEAVPPPAVSSSDPNEVTQSGYRATGSRERVCVPSDFAAGLTPVAAEAGAERRTGTRHAYAGRRVVALGDEAARVLIGRDVSVGGMRVERSVDLSVGQRFRVAIHAAAGETPLVVPAEVLRDDGERGFAVRFTDLEPEAARYLAKLVDSLPVLADGEGLVVSQIVDPPA